MSDGAARRRWTTWLAPVCVGTVTFLAFLPALHNGFVSWDDDKNFLANPHYRGLGLEQLNWMWTTFHMGHYAPLTWMTLGLDYVLWGMNPMGYHLASVLLHVANAVALYFVARMLFRSVGALPAVAGNARPRANREILEGEFERTSTFAAAVAALLFALHPLRVESVAWATERRDVLSLLFALLCLLAYLRSTGDVHARRWYWTSVVLFACALLSKATVMTLPIVLLVINVYPLRRLTASRVSSVAARRVAMELAPFVLLSVVSMIVSVVALHPAAQLSPTGKVAVSAFSLCFYLWKTIAPVALSPLYEMPRIVDAGAARYVASYAAIVLLTIAAFAARHRWPALAAAWLAFVALSLPMLGVIQNGPQIAADRYTYHSSPALALLAGVVMIHAMSRVRLVLVRAATAGLVLTLAALTWKQCAVWRDSSSLWARVLTVDPQSAYAHSASATLLFQSNHVEEGLKESREATVLNPELAEAHNNLGVGLAREGRFDEAVVHYRRALELKPLYDEAEGNWGLALAKLGQPDSAVSHYQRALGANPDNADAQVNWGNALVRAGRYLEAVPHYEAAIAIRPDDADAHLNWGVALARDSKLVAAIEHFRLALALDSTSTDAKRYLDRALALSK
ncbi:MAG: tetratricopeptide repeat protein [Gemmatimonadota bacterium]|nr:tetratricopeptide repeat protein [Gemmatimonadota bacterium]